MKTKPYKAKSLAGAEPTHGTWEVFDLQDRHVVKDDCGAVLAIIPHEQPTWNDTRREPCRSEVFANSRIFAAALEAETVLRLQFERDVLFAIHVQTSTDLGDVKTYERPEYLAWATKQDEAREAFQKWAKNRGLKSPAEEAVAARLPVSPPSPAKGGE